MQPSRVISIITIFATLILVGCVKETPVGSLAFFDLRGHLPTEVLAIAPTDGTAMEYTKTISVGESSSQVLIKWTAFKDGENTYLLSVNLQVLDAKGIELRASIAEPLNHGKSDAVIEMISLQIGWDNSTLLTNRSGVSQFTVLSTGEWMDK
jgi:hypothetical protein